MKDSIKQFKKKLARKSFNSHEFRKFKNFPVACCVLSSHLLARFLIREHSCTNVQVVHGERSNHAWNYWVEIENKVVDIPMQQFQINDVILDDSLWHSKCRVLERWTINYNFEDVEEGADSSTAEVLENTYQSIVNPE